MSLTSPSQIAMAWLSTVIWVLTICISPAIASRGVAGHGFVGNGITMYKPTCASACRDSVSNPLDCEGNHMIKRMGSMAMKKPSPECYATNDLFLQSVAYCMSVRCEDVPTWKLERWWAKRIVGRQTIQPMPKETYQDALRNIDTPPNSTIPSDEVLHEMTLVDDATYIANYNGDGIFEVNEGTHVRFGLALLLTGAGIPLGLSLLRFVPFPPHLVSRFKALFIDPPAFGSKHRSPLLNTFIAPTRGQAFFIAYLWIINIILCSVGYQNRWPNTWFTDPSQETVTYIAYRTGILSFANLGLLVLYAGRNNILLWVTNWSHSTFLLLHRWIAFICCLQACIHSAMLLQVYLNSSDYDYSTEHKLPYWIWGIVATMGMVILLPTSVLPLRQKLYELFLAWHVVLAFFVLIGCYYHVVLGFGHQWGYETWIYIAFAIWAFDRAMRVLRMARNGVRHAQVTILDDDYIRIDIPGISASGHAYLYFPTLTWRLWENHPFSVAGVVLSTDISSSQPESSRSSTGDAEKPAIPKVTPIDTQPSDHSTRQTKSYETGLTFFVRSQTGLTVNLRSRKRIPVLIESSYSQSLFDDHNLSSYPRLVCIAGGVGITAILPYLSSHLGQNKLYWGLRSDTLAKAVRDHNLDHVEVITSIGERLNLREILEREIENDSGKGTAIIVSGPATMADEVRCLASEFTIKNKKAVIHFIEESYSW